VLALDLDIVLHDGRGTASTWAATASAGGAAAVSGPGRGYAVDPDAGNYLLVGDETAIPAISQLLEALPDSTPAAVHIEVADATGRVPVPSHPRATVTWHELGVGAPPGDTLVDAVHTATVTDDTLVWAAGEAAAMQRIRRHLFEQRAVRRSRATVRGYWKHGRSGDTAEV
jgi:NADPH-dependent ferric siderophore reductase